MEIYNFLESKYGSSYHMMARFIVKSYHETSNTDDFITMLNELKQDSLVKYYCTAHLIYLLFNNNGSKKIYLILNFSLMKAYLYKIINFLNYNKFNIIKY